MNENIAAAVTATTVVLENWGLCFDSNNPFLAPELRRQCLNGEVYGHPDPRFPDGKRITTSTIVEADWAKREVRCASRVYTLGKPHPQFLAMLRERDLGMLAALGEHPVGPLFF